MLHNSLCLAPMTDYRSAKGTGNFLDTSGNWNSLLFVQAAKACKIFFVTCREKRFKFPLHLSRAIFKFGLHEKPEAGLVPAMNLASLPVTVPAPSRAAQYVCMSTEHQQSSPEN